MRCGVGLVMRRGKCFSFWTLSRGIQSRRSDTKYDWIVLCRDYYVAQDTGQVGS